MFNQYFKSLCVLVAAIYVSTLPLFAASIDEVDRYVESVQETFHVPGVAIGIIKDGQIIHIKGYGIADVDRGNEVDEYTLFKIASNSKAFTTAGLAIQVDKGLLQWSDKVSQHLADFKLYDDYASEQFNIIDLLTHRSGLGLGAGDLMLWPEPTKFTREQLVQNLRYLKPAYGFRERYAYDNTLYIVAGEVSAAIAGSSWEQHIETSIFEPLGMEHCVAGGVDTSKITNVVAPHHYIDGKIVVDQPNRIRKKTNLMAAAGGIKCSVNDLLSWVDVQLRGGVSKDGVRIFSEKQAQKMWYPVTPLSVSKTAKSFDNTHYRGYALGWRINDYHSQWQVSHTGTLSGAMSQVVLMPDMNLGIIILINQSSGYARSALARGILQQFLDIEPRDWIAHYQEQQRLRQEALMHDDAKEMGLLLPSEKIIKNTSRNRKRLGIYKDPWFGKVSLKRRGDEILFSSDKLPRLLGKAYAFDDNTWWVKWDNRSFEADAWLKFERKKGKLYMTMNRILEDSDWSFSFQDLFFTKTRR